MNTKPLRQFYGIVINSAVNGYYYVMFNQSSGVDTGTIP
jgi:hypothetical protein